MVGGTELNQTLCSLELFGAWQFCIESGKGIRQKAALAIIQKRTFVP
jgi:hypothetical protein